jgi:hypothetical protein
MKYYFLKAIATGTPGAKKRSDAAACRHHSQRLFYAEVFEHVWTRYCPRRTGGRMKTRDAVCSEMVRTAAQSAAPCSTVILSGVIIRLVAWLQSLARSWQVVVFFFHLGCVAKWLGSFSSSKQPWGWEVYTGFCGHCVAVRWNGFSRLT